MRTDTPSDMPTHLFYNPDAFITNSCKFLRKTSLDELSQLINIEKVEISIIGSRPALWNQDDLAGERDKHQADSILPGLTGWAQINVSDELPITVKAKLDGEYVDRMSFGFDAKCFVGTNVSITKNAGMVEGKSNSWNLNSLSKNQFMRLNKPKKNAIIKKIS